MVSLLDSQLSKISDITLIKEGGQKKVFVGNHSDYGKVVIKRGSFTTITGLERIRREIDFLKSIDNLYYPKNYDFFIELGSKEFLIIEEFIPNIPYDQVRDTYKGEINIIKLFKELLKALSLLWDNNIIHRDLKPDNILFDSDKRPRIIDLGIARFLDYSSLTQTSALRGPCTPVYAAPEQLTNQKNIIDVRTDLFALGIYLLELEYNYHPFDPEKVQNQLSIPENIINGYYVIPSEDMGYSTEFCIMINKLLQVQQFKRFRNHKILIDFINSNW